MKTAWLFLALPLVALPARARAQAKSGPQAAAAPATKPQDPVGVFDVSFTNTSGQHSGRLVIKANGNTYEGTVAPDGADVFAFSSLAFEKDSAIFKIAPPGAPGDVTFHLKFDGTSFSGRYEGLENGQITGKKIR